MITDDVTLDEGVVIYHPELINLYGCKIGSGCKIATFVEIQRGVVLGKNCKVESFAFICSGVEVGDGVFIGPHVCFTNDKNPKAVNADGSLLTPNDWTLSKTVIEDRVAIGANSTIVCGIRIGKGSLIGAGSVVTKDVPPYSLVVGNPARIVRKIH